MNICHIYYMYIYDIINECANYIRQKLLHFMRRSNYYTYLYYFVLVIFYYL